MRVDFINNWRRISKKYGNIKIFTVYWQFDEYVKRIEIEIFNFTIEITLEKA